MKPHFSLILWCMRNCAAGREDALFDPPLCLRLNLRWETFLSPETVAAQWIRVCGPAQYGLKAARPVVKCGNDYIDLSKEKDVRIDKLL